MKKTDLDKEEKYEKDYGMGYVARSIAFDRLKENGQVIDSEEEYRMR